MMAKIHWIPDTKFEKMLDTILAFSDRYEGADRSEFFCGKSQNPDWRIHEHGTDENTYQEYIKDWEFVKCASSVEADHLLAGLNTLGFDTGCQMGSGQPSSRYVYIYHKTEDTFEYLSAHITLEYFFAEREDFHHPFGGPEGIFAAFACNSESSDGHSIEVKRPIFLGRTDSDESVWDAIINHRGEEEDEWLKYYDPKEETIWYAAIPVERESSLIDTLLSALIYRLQPSANREQRSRYRGDYDRMVIDLKGPRGLFPRRYTVKVPDLKRGTKIKEIDLDEK